MNYKRFHSYPPTPLPPYTKTKQQNLRFSQDFDMNDYQHGAISGFVLTVDA